MAEKKTTTKTTRKAKKVEVETKPMRAFKDLRRILTKDTEVLIMNNTQGHFYYSCPKTNIGVDLSGFGDTQVVSLELLETMKRRAKKFFQNYLIMIIDVYPDTDEEITVLDVLRYLDIQSLYKDIEMISDEDENNGHVYGEDFFDDLIVEKSKAEFDKIVRKMNKKLLIQFAHRCIELYRTGEFDSRYKMDTLQELLKNEDLFSDIDLTI